MDLGRENKVALVTAGSKGRARRQRRKKKCRLADEVPLGRMGRVEEFVKAVAWPASPAASFIHGHALMFDGGAVRSAR
ncbi:MAG: family oxidoreductase [Dehalococcoidia bacterium]|nr:family oxidoreductase [Dehalococcoidia bacterium]